MNCTCLERLFKLGCDATPSNFCLSHSHDLCRTEISTSFESVNISQHTVFQRIPTVCENCFDRDQKRISLLTEYMELSQVFNQTIKDNNYGLRDFTCICYSHPLLNASLCIYLVRVVVLSSFWHFRYRTF